MSAKKSVPNIVMIMTDQQRGDCLGSAGHPVLETPNLDALASAGTRFDCAYSASPSCVPARASLLTGMTPWHTGILGMGGGQGPPSCNFAHTLPGELALAGYHTQAIGKNHFDPQRALNGYHNCILDESGRSQSPGFVSDYRAWFDQNKGGSFGYADHSIDWNSWMSRPTHLPEHLHPTHWTAQQGIDFLDRRDPSKPFFLKLSFARPHSPYDPPQTYYDMYRDRPMPQPAVGDWVDIYEGRGNCDAIDAWQSQRSEVENQRARACYYGSITFIDHQIGRFVNALRRGNDPDLFSNTLIVFLSDHGDMLGDHHLWRKTYAYEGSTHVPMIVRPPLSWDMPRGQVRREVVELRDIMPTLLAAADVAIPETCDGLNMMPLAGGESCDWRPYLHGEHVACYDTSQAMQYLTDGREKYVYLPYLGVEQLFDLIDDPTECHDLARHAQHAGRVSRWRSRLVEELTQRQSVMVCDGQLQTLADDQLLHSPHYGHYGIAP